MIAERQRRQLRAAAAEALSLGASRADLIADLLCVTRKVSAPGTREGADAEDLARDWADLDAYAAAPAFDDTGPPTRL